VKQFPQFIIIRQVLASSAASQVNGATIEIAE
jgi:hypothetical protein